ncbi:MAG TPA: hypothetical protein VK886_19055 [Vicinamibacterales bacterium]|nr:hypothetical protein [Vicinamibacterales bacterium]
MVRTKIVAGGSAWSAAPVLVMILSLGFASSSVAQVSNAPQTPPTPQAGAASQPSSAPQPSSAAQTAPARTSSDADTAALESLLDRAAATAPGTYVVTGSSLAPEPSAISVALQADVLRGAQNAIRVPVVVGALVTRPAMVRVRIVSTAGGAPRIVDAGSGSAEPGIVRLVRDFTLSPAEYEIHAVVGERRGDTLVAALAKRQIAVPDIWSAPLAVTPIVIGDSVANRERAEDKPFIFGPSALTPAISPQFSQNGAMNVAFRVYNWAADSTETPEAAKPDVTVEYVFYEQRSNRMTFFNKMKPQRLGEKLAAGFTPASGMVTAGMMVPLASFPIGDFELRVRVTDNRSKRTAEQRVVFTVGP